MVTKKWFKEQLNELFDDFYEIAMEIVIEEVADNVFNDNTYDLIMNEVENKAAKILNKAFKKVENESAGELLDAFKEVVRVAKETRRKYQKK